MTPSNLKFRRFAAMQTHHDFVMKHFLVLRSELKRLRPRSEIVHKAKKSNLQGLRKSDCVPRIRHGPRTPATRNPNPPHAFNNSNLINCTNSRLQRKLTHDWIILVISICVVNFARRKRINQRIPLSSEYVTSVTVEARFWPWQNFLTLSRCSLFARQWSDQHLPGPSSWKASSHPAPPPSPQGQCLRVGLRVLPSGFLLTGLGHAGEVRGFRDFSVECAKFRVQRLGVRPGEGAEFRVK